MPVSRFFNWGVFGTANDILNHVVKLSFHPNSGLVDFFTSIVDKSVHQDALVEALGVIDYSAYDALNANQKNQVKTLIAQALTEESKKHETEYLYKDEYEHRGSPSPWVPKVGRGLRIDLIGRGSDGVGCDHSSGGIKFPRGLFGNKELLANTICSALQGSAYGNLLRGKFVENLLVSLGMPKVQANIVNGYDNSNLRVPTP